MITSADMLANYRAMVETMTGNPRAASVKFTQDMGWEFIAALLRALKDGEEALRATESSNTSSASAGRDEYGGPSEQVDNSSQSVIGLPRCGGEGSNLPDISPRASGQLMWGDYSAITFEEAKQ